MNLSYINCHIYNQPLINTKNTRIVLLLIEIDSLQIADWIKISAKYLVVLVPNRKSNIFLSKYYKKMFKGQLYWVKKNKLY